MSRMTTDDLKNAAPEHPPIITLTTDFGLSDPYVGMMKGVILGIAPHALVIDLTHDVQPQNVEQAAFLLGGCLGCFPPGAIHLVVVDPGVGGERRAIAAAGDRAMYVAPDNGVLTRAMAVDPPRRIVEVRAAAYRLPRVSRTFHGRDIFAPAAAHLAAGVPLNELGPSIMDPVKLNVPPPVRQPDGAAAGRVCHVDRFGNCVTDLPGEWARAGSEWALEVRGRLLVRLRDTYASVPAGNVLAVIGGTGYIEIAVRNGSAAAAFGIRVGDEVLLQPRTP
ncbi:MAG: SAM-dependent chlorinase/fluorinase [Kiritimatiellaeota bacterium]|nr:SAM-dependent chlorinase/fluorinase [Kiritimatiellota bacterium]